MADLTVRPATNADLPALGRLGAALMRTHHDFDPQRFLSPGDDPETGYAMFLRTQLSTADSIVLVAEREDDILGYVHAGIEPHSWKELRDEAGFIHDVLVVESARRDRVATALIEAAIQWLKERGAQRVVIWTAERNPPAQRLFTALGFRRTMIEMTKELPS
jgi:GNAT superfamily N-acetyltransferase